MRRKILTAFISLFALFGFVAPVSATEDVPPPGCDAVRESFLGGQRIMVYCDYLPYPPYLYRVIAHCAAASSYWYELGFWVEPGFGPSVAECRGNLLNAARVVGYHIDER